MANSRERKDGYAAYLAAWMLVTLALGGVAYILLS
jgi:hypothetical protein